MGRELKRVPLDFDAPLKQTWSGYLPPKWRECPSDDCENGMTIAARWLEGIVHLILMLPDAAAQPYYTPIHPWLAALPLVPTKNVKGVGPRIRPPGPQIAELTGGLAGRAPRSPFGHDAIDRWNAVKAIVVAAGLDEDWGICPVCEGHAIHPDDRPAQEAWERTDPPEGEGYQLWETTSEGSPISPVFATLDELCEYAQDNCTVFGGSTATAAEWKSMLDAGFVAMTMTNPDGTKALWI